ncbi:MAG: hypothetical protein A2Y04_02945 [Omnitrophica WOR_2 bacterium GWC2_45_7]|nr:MAG: hypothetical protein A2Y04_02945 [Omnitrophica WOR_2 bacterium GWC2_45_7]
MIIRGITVHPDNPLQFDFVLDTGDSGLGPESPALRQEATKLIKYFLAALTVPEKEMWVNLSPYEKDRIIAQGLGDTEMGRDLLAQDYLLKQLTASLMYPEDELGKAFWERVYQKAQEQFGVTEISQNTFHKIWIVPSKAEVHEYGASAYVVDSKLKVMLEEDYLALEKEHRDTRTQEHRGTGGQEPKGTGARDGFKILNPYITSIIREILIPEIEKEVNEGKTFANLRQIYNSMILAAWFKMNVKESLLGRSYVDQNKTAGVDTDDKQINQKIYDQYIAAFKKGVYDYIKEDYDPATQQILPRKYFSGGVNQAMLTKKVLHVLKHPLEQFKGKVPAAILSVLLVGGGELFNFEVGIASASDKNQGSVLQQEDFSNRVREYKKLLGSKNTQDRDYVWNEIFTKGYYEPDFMKEMIPTLVSILKNPKTELDERIFTAKIFGLMAASGSQGVIFFHKPKIILEMTRDLRELLIGKKAVKEPGLRVEIVRALAESLGRMYEELSVRDDDKTQKEMDEEHETRAGVRALTELVKIEKDEQVLRTLIEAIGFVGSRNARALGDDTKEILRKITVDFPSLKGVVVDAVGKMEASTYLDKIIDIRNQLNLDKGFSVFSKELELQMSTPEFKRTSFWLKASIVGKLYRICLKDKTKGDVYAVAANLSERITLLIIEAGVDPSKINEDLNTALGMAYNEGNYSLLENLLITIQWIISATQDKTTLEGLKPYLDNLSSQLTKEPLNKHQEHFLGIIQGMLKSIEEKFNEPKKEKSIPPSEKQENEGKERGDKSLGGPGEFTQGAERKDNAVDAAMLGRGARAFISLPPKKKTIKLNSKPKQEENINAKRVMRFKPKLKIEDAVLKTSGVFDAFLTKFPNEVIAQDAKRILKESMSPDKFKENLKSWIVTYENELPSHPNAGSAGFYSDNKNRRDAVLDFLTELDKVYQGLNGKGGAATKDNAQVGGINLDSAMIDWKIKRDGQGFVLPLDQQPSAVFDVPGVIPFIINITPIPVPVSMKEKVNGQLALRRAN